jgi:hypothetical protein
VCLFESRKQLFSADLPPVSLPSGS